VMKNGGHGLLQDLARLERLRHECGGLHRSGHAHRRPAQALARTLLKKLLRVAS
jgi:hypothetical protein